MSASSGALPPSGLDVVRRLAILLAVGVVAVNVLLIFLAPTGFQNSSEPETASVPNKPATLARIQERKLADLSVRWR